MLFRPDNEVRVIMKSWKVIEVSSDLVNDKTRHLVGVVGDFGRVCSPIQEFDTDAMEVTTRSGKVYELVGKPNENADSEYVLESWCSMNKITEVTDVTSEYYSSVALSKTQEAWINDYDEAAEWWDSLSQEDREKAFHAVISKMYKAEVLDRGTYRYALYDVFGLDSSMYRKGMYSGYFTLHNLIADALDAEDALDPGVYSVDSK